MKLYRLLARAIFWLHVILSAWVFVGGAVATVRPAYAPIHIVFLLSILIVQGLRGWRCPLTDLEKSLLVRSGGETYKGGFIRHYMADLGVTIPEGWIVRSTLIVLVWCFFIWGTSAWMKN